MAQNIDGKIRIFKNPFLESLSQTTFIQPLMFWTPVICFFTYLSLNELRLNLFLSYFFLGVFLWTLLEYVLHRFLFHLKTKNPYLKSLVFIFHGIHHSTPQDKTRLLFPPLPASFIAIPIYLLLSVSLQSSLHYPIFIGLLVGYLIYDYIHYATHHFKMNSKMARYLKVYHLRHHHVCPQKNFGVSSPLWDLVFKTKEAKKKKAL